MSNERRRQKKREQQKKRREAIKMQVRQQQRGMATSLEGVIRQAASCPFGPAFVSPGWDDIGGAGVPSLVSVVMTRKLSANRLVPGVALVDRTCLGVKNGFARPPMGLIELNAFLDNIGQSFDEDMVQCDPLVAQSIVFHAIDYARSLGFSPHRDFPAALFGPRPDKLIDTPCARPAKPIFIAGPHDNVSQILSRLERAVGRGNFVFALGSPEFLIPDGPPMVMLAEEAVDECEEFEEGDDV